MTKDYIKWAGEAGPRRFLESLVVAASARVAYRPRLPAVVALQRPLLHTSQHHLRTLCKATTLPTFRFTFLAGIVSPKVTQAYFGELRGAKALDALAPDEVGWAGCVTHMLESELGTACSCGAPAAVLHASSLAPPAAPPTESPRIACPQIFVTVPRAAAIVVAPNERCPCPDFVDPGASFLHVALCGWQFGRRAYAVAPWG